MDQRLSDYRRRVNLTLKLYVAWGIIVLVFTILMGTRGNVITTSMSAMGNASNLSHVLFIIWTVVFCGYFGSLTGFILVLTQRTHSRVRGFVYVAVAIMIIGDIVPFVPEEHPFMAFLHNTCAQISSLSMAFTLLLLAISVRRLYPAIYRRALIWVLVIWAFLLAGISLIGTKALTEMFGVLAATVFLWVFARDIVHEEGFSASAVMSANDAEEAEAEADKLEKKARELEEEYMQAEAKARHARLAAEQLRRIERKHRNPAV